MMASTKFDPARAESLFHELGDPRYAGPDGEARVADLVARRFAEMGLDVERREVTGSRFPQRAAPWVGWLGCGLSLTVACLLIRWGTIPSLLLAVLFAASSVWCFNAVVAHWIHVGRRRRPLETAPVMLAAPHRDGPAPARVIFQTLLGSLDAGIVYRLTTRRPALILLPILGPIILVLCAIGHQLARLLSHGRTVHVAFHGILMVCMGLCAVAWLGILGLLALEHREAMRRRGSYRVERRGLSVLLEMARTWPRSGGRPVEAVFVAAGGQQLDHAGSREIVRLLGSEWSSRPSLLVLLFAPGAGQELWLCTNALPGSGVRRLAEGAARGLWIPIRGNDLLALFPLWPFEKCHPAVALIGSDAWAFDDDTVDPPALHRCAQLATEMALRWARERGAAGSSGSAG
jgi:hypothetical protein